MTSETRHFLWFLAAAAVVAATMAYIEHLACP